MGQFDLQPNFPISGVADLIANRPYKEAQMRLQQQQQLVQGLQGFGQGVQSLVDRRNAMAQALSGAQMFAQSPEGQQMLAPTVTSQTTQAPVMRNQTAAFDPSTGTVAPNTDMSGVGTMGPPKTTTTSTPSPVNMGTLQTAMYGEKPSDMLTQLFNRQKERQTMALENRKQAFTEKIKPLELAQQERLTNALTGVKASQVTGEQANNIRAQITSLEAKKTGIIKDFPELAGSVLSGVLPEGLNQKEAAAIQDYKDTQEQIDGYKQQLSNSGAGGGVSRRGKVGVTLTTPGGLTYTVNNQ